MERCSTLRMERCSTLRSVRQKREEEEEEEKPPVLMTIPNSISTPDRSLLEIPTAKSHILSNPNFKDAFCFCNKRGWLLMGQRVKDVGHVIPEITFPSFFLNPTTGARIDLPPLDCYSTGPATFSLKPDGTTPDLVVNVENKYMRVNEHGNVRYTQKVVIIKVLRRVGESSSSSSWGEEEYVVTDDLESVTVDQVDVAGTRVLCHVASGRVITLDLSTGEAKYVRPGPVVFGSYYDTEVPHMEERRSFMLESEGVFYKVLCNEPHFSSFTFQWFDWATSAWVDMSERDLEDKSWFLGDGCSRMRRGGGEGRRKVLYTYEANEYDGPTLPPDFVSWTQRDPQVIPTVKDPGNLGDEEKEYNVYIHNLLDGADKNTTTRSLLPEAFVGHGQALWLDLADGGDHVSSD